MPRFEFLWSRLVDLLQRYPRAIALFGLISGLASFFLVERQQGLVRVIALIMLAGWALLLLERVLRLRFAQRFGRPLPPAVLRFLTQMMHQESLFFVLPFFTVTTTWASAQALFSGLLIAGAVVALWDPWYYRGLAPRRWLFLGFHCLTLFAVLLVALPLIWQLNTAQSYELALLATVVLALPAFWDVLPWAAWRRAPALLGLALVLLLGGWLIRLAVPPATLWLAQGVISTSLNSELREPGPAQTRIGEAELRAQGLYAFTAISAPRGLNEHIYHVWQQEGAAQDRIALDIHGGRKEGYRAWTRKENFPEQVKGRWQVRVQTETGQLIGVLRFRVD